MSAKTQIKSSLKRLARKTAFGFISLSSFIIGSPAFGASIDFNTWNSLGDIVTNTNEATLTNAFPDSSDDGGTNYNVSGNTPISIFGAALETFLGVQPGNLDNRLNILADEGSALRRTLANVLVGDAISFNSTFETFDNVNSDSAFVTVFNSTTNNLVDVRSLGLGNSNFNYTFNTAGNYILGVGVVDVNDSVGSSRLRLSDASYQPVPEPLTVLGSLTALGFGVGLRQRFRKKAQ
jgi:hypothetical protein